ncbi:MAG: Fe-S oxidoreductase [Flavobacteriales bacterium]|nr:Fe-S oxidoreductase [Flavobacteriales bacterium]|tara:strand:- start:5307 stop:6629 length:1323 start_codon:yes stop_codon:yes gene_type:complete
MGLSNLIFALSLGIAGFIFGRNVLRIKRNIQIGVDIDRFDRPSLRWKTMARVALGQSKMTVRPIAAFLHALVYVGFVVINIEVLEIIIDGLFGTHRVFSFLGGLYDFLIGSFEILAFLVLVACVIFAIRRNVLQIKRFVMKEMDGWPKTDANLILVFEILLMSAFLLLQSSDLHLQNLGVDHYVQAGSYPISSWFLPLFSSMDIQTVYLFERGLWWFHIIGILVFLNYLPYSKHFHIILAFPNTYFSNLDAKGSFTNMASVTQEVKIMMDPNADPYAVPDGGVEEESLQRFGAKDVNDLNWVQLMNAYSCSECGRCTSECPANQTGKLLSPRKIMMDTRDRLEEYSTNITANGPESKDGLSLLDDYISREELWACTSCNACTQACPLNIDPLSIIIDMRRYLVMEESAAPTELNSMFNNVENNGAPWQFPALDRLKWRDE